MTLSEFVKKYSNRFVEYHSFSTGSHNQCVDLANQYITEVLKLPAIIGTNAQDFPSRKGNNFDYTENTPEGLPNPGDLMIFKSADGVGHISIFIEGNLSLFTSFDQNYPSGSPCKLVRHNYRNVLGWMRPKGSNMANELDACLKDRQKFWDERDTLLRELQAESVEGGLSTIRGYRSRITDLGNQLGTAQAEVKNRAEQVERLKVESANKEQEIKDLQIKLNDMKNEVNQFAQDKGKLAIEVEQLRTQLESAKQGEYTVTLYEFIQLLLHQKIKVTKGLLK